MATDKDRFGDTLKKKEKAEEDLYFAKQEKDKLAKLRGQNAPVAQLGLCPRCGLALDETDHQGLKVDVCGKCKGLWLDAGELEKVVARDGEGWMSRWVRSLLES